MLRVTPARRRVSARYGKPATKGRPAMARCSAACRFSIALLTEALLRQVVSISAILSNRTLAIDWRHRRALVRLPRSQCVVDFFHRSVPRDVRLRFAAVDGIELSIRSCNS